MSHQITLTDDEYEALAEAAAARGQPVEELVREMLAERFPAVQSNSPQPHGSLVEAMWHAGHLSNLAPRTPDTPEVAAERKRLAGSITPGKLASEMVIEDRGPR
ncbi:MAG TPA: ribbon-helix-helix protein, CopG family [Ktedonobacterales bacterium]